MRQQDKQLGKPEILYRDTKANIEAIANPILAMKAFATDVGNEGFYNGSAWIWSNTGSSGGGHTIQDDGVNQTQRTNLNFIGTGFYLWDDAGNNATIISGTSGVGPQGPIGPTGTAGTPGASGPPGSNTLFIYDDSVFKITGTAISFDTNLSVATTGSIAFVSSSASGGGLYSAYINFQDVKSSGTAGGTFTANAWQTRILNTEQADTGNHATLNTGSQITLDAGTYLCHAICPAAYVERHQARLQNITDNETLLLGTSNRSQAALARVTENNSEIKGRFTISGAKVIEVQHRCGTTRATDGFGEAAGFGQELYTIVEFWKET